MVRVRWPLCGSLRVSSYGGEKDRDRGRDLGGDVDAALAEDEYQQDRCATCCASCGDLGVRTSGSVHTSARLTESGSYVGLHTRAPTIRGVGLRTSDHSGTHVQLM